MPISSFLGTTNQFTVNNADPTDPIISLSSSFAFPSGTDVEVTDVFFGNQISYGRFENIWTALAPSFPVSGQTAYVFSDATGNLSCNQYYAQLFNNNLTFQFGGVSSILLLGTFINQIGNQICVSFNLIDLNNINTATTPWLDRGILCTNTSLQVINQTTDISSGISAEIIPSYLASGQSLCIGQLPIAQVDPLATTLAANCLRYYLGNVYLYNNGTTAQFYFTLGSAFGGVTPTANQFVSGNYYSFGYLGIAPQPIVALSPYQVPVFPSVTYTYSLV